MLNAVLSFFKRKNEAQEQPAETPAPGSREREEPKKSSPAVFLPVSSLPPPPVDMDTMGGEVSITYESIAGKPQRHFTRIFIDPAFMPVITAGAKPGNKQYLVVKHDMLLQALHSLTPYMHFVLSLKGMNEREDLRRALEVILKRFLARFWDMPASLDHHHSYPWGFTLHCIDVACAEAEKATSWIPMSEHGIDEINHARYLGMVVLLHFTKGLFHDAHKLYQYEMTGYSGNHTITFDPLRHQGNVLDFKLVYPQRTEAWGEPAANPGKLNALEFCALFPRELLQYAPSSQFMEVFTAVFDLEGMDSDQDSVKRDITRAGRLTIEQMILRQVREYFTTAKETTKPENNVFKVNDEWTAVNSSQFLMKIRPLDGSVYSKAGVKNHLMQEGVLAGSGNKYEVTVRYKIQLPKGDETVGKSGIKIAFIRTSYLLQACPELHDLIGQVFFEEKDREDIQQLCPGAGNFLPDLNKQKIETQPPAKTSADTRQSAPEKDGAAAQICSPSVDGGEQEQKSPFPTFMEEKDALDSGDTQAATEPDSIVQNGETASGEPSVEHMQQAKPDEAELLPESAVAAAAVAPDLPVKNRKKHQVKPLIKWSSQLRHLLQNYRPTDSCPKTGWLYAGILKVHVRTPRFYQKMTNEGLLKQPDWGIVAESICRELSEEGLLILRPITGRIDYTPPGGSDEAHADGAFLELSLDMETYSLLYDKVMRSSPLPEGE